MKTAVVKTVWRTIKGRKVCIEISSSKFGYQGGWACPEVGAQGGNATYQPTMEKALLVTELSAFAEIPQAAAA